MVTKKERERGEINKFRINRYKPLYIKEIINKDLLYSIGNYIQYFVMVYNGKSENIIFIYMYVYMGIYEYIYIYKLYHFALHLTLIQYCKSTILKYKEN